MHFKGTTLSVHLLTAINNYIVYCKCQCKLNSLCWKYTNIKGCIPSCIVAIRQTPHCYLSVYIANTSISYKGYRRIYELDESWSDILMTTLCIHCITFYILYPSYGQHCKVPAQLSRCIAIYHLRDFITGEYQTSTLPQFLKMFSEIQLVGNAIFSMKYK